MTLKDTTNPQALKVLIVEDDEQMAESTRVLLEKEAFEVVVCHSAEGGLERARSFGADFVLLDLTLPGMGGLEACRQLRAFSDAYVIMLTALDSEADRLVGLAVGADDYMGKPFSPRELVARIRAMQRRPRAAAGTAPRTFGALEIDAGARRVTVDGNPIELSRTEFDILDTLSANSRVSLSRRQLLEAIWGASWFGDDHVIDVHISNLRRKLGAGPYVETVRGFGYRMAKADS
jgi:DNA-binding response OmpR family regulator